MIVVKVNEVEQEGEWVVKDNIRYFVSEKGKKELEKDWPDMHSDYIINVINENNECETHNIVINHNDEKSDK
jgi:hypothetical protein